MISFETVHASPPRVTPIAVIGMACRLPGGIDSPEKLWDALLRGDDLVTEIPPDRWDADEYHDPEPGVPGRSVSKWGAFLDDIAGFDSEFFGINEREAIATDPQHRLLLETSWEAIEHAGQTHETIGERDGDRILAVIRGTAANQDGRTVNIATPQKERMLAERLLTLPAGLGDAEAAALTTATATAWYGLNDLARIGPGDKVLIHSATGGVGRAAIAIAHAAGAEVFATAGSEQRRQLLRDMGIHHVYDSRSLEFADGIRRDTDGYGVDIMLNSVTGAAQRAGLELLAFGGRFIEIGKRDIYGDTRLGLFPFRRNLSFYAVDLALMSASHPGRVQESLRKVYQLAADGSLPVPECTHYPLAGAATAIRMMSGAQHTGKLVLDIPHRLQPGGSAAGAGSGVPRRRRLCDHRWPGWAGVVPRREDGYGRLRADRAVLAVAAESRGAADDRAHPADWCRGGGGVWRHRRTGHRGEAGGCGHCHRASVARRAAWGGRDRGRHTYQHHR